MSTEPISDLAQARATFEQWREASTQLDLRQGILVIDDSTLDKPYARKMELVSSLVGETSARGEQDQPHHFALDRR